jgi:two-component system copper resistance phosphate regulon response regulator CusR
MNILVVEDEQKVAAFLKSGLEEQGYQVDVALNAQDGEPMLLRKSYDLLLLDVVMPGMNGIAFCKRIRQAMPGIPIIMLTALGTTHDKLAGFEAGVDDYLVKPFEFSELVARIRALIKRTQNFHHEIVTHEILRVGDFQLDIGKKVAIRGEKIIPLTAKEFCLLEILMRNKGRVVPKLDIAERVWNVTADSGTNIVEVYVNILRKKIDKDFPVKLIQTRIGLGYIIPDSL